MDDEYNLTEEDKQSGLEKILYDARDTAAEALGDFFAKIGVDQKYFSFIKGMPIGAEEGSDIPGAYDPGIYGIVVGRDSEDLLEFEESDEKSRDKISKSLARTIAHEMIHSVQTVKSVHADDFPDTIGGAIMGWSGLEEGMAEALANIVVKMHLSGDDLETTASDLEDYCSRKGTVPCTMLSARLVRKMSPELLNWYITCGPSESFRKENKLMDALGADDYKVFLKNMRKLEDYEEETTDRPTNYDELVSQTAAIIDKIQ